MTELLSHLGQGMGVVFFHSVYWLFGSIPIPHERSVLPARRAGRHPGRRSARHRHGRHHRHAAADHLRAAAGRRPDHARRHLLRRAIWRLDHVGPGQHPGRGDLGCHLPRRPPDGAAGPRRAGALHRRHRLVLRRLRGDGAGRRARRPADRASRCCSVRPSISR